MRALAGWIAAGIAAGAVPATAAPDLFVVAKREAALHRIDAAGKAPPARVPLGVNGHEVTLSADGRLAYVPIYGDSALGKPGSNGSTIEVIDTAAMRRIDTIDLGEGVRPHSAVLDRDGRLWVTAEIAEAVLLVDPKTKRVVGRAPTGQPESHSLALSPDGRRLYTSNVGAGSVSVIDTAARKLVAVVPVAKRVQRVTASPDGRFVFAHDTQAPRLAVIDTATNELARWIELPDPAYASAATPDGRFLLVGSPVARRLHVVDLARLAVVRSLDPGCDPAYVVADGNGRKAYLSCPRDGKIAVLDLASMAMDAALPVEPGIEGIALTGAR